MAVEQKRKHYVKQALLLFQINVETVGGRRITTEGYLNKQIFKQTDKQTEKVRSSPKQIFQQPVFEISELSSIYFWKSIPVTVEGKGIYTFHPRYSNPFFTPT